MLGWAMACAHELVLNGACYYCGTTDLDPEALSPRPAATLVPAARLRRGRPAPRDRADPEPAVEAPKTPDEG